MEKPKFKTKKFLVTVKYRADFNLGLQDVRDNAKRLTFYTGEKATVKEVKE